MGTQVRSDFLSRLKVFFQYITNRISDSFAYKYCFFKVGHQPKFNIELTFRCDQDLLFQCPTSM